MVPAPPCVPYDVCVGCQEWTIFFINRVALCLDCQEVQRSSGTPHSGAAAAAAAAALSGSSAAAAGDPQDTAQPEPEAERNSTPGSSSNAPFPPPDSGTGKRFYVLRAEHGHGATIACGWDLAARICRESGCRPPRGYASLEEAVANCFGNHGGGFVTIIR